eukprot:Gb_18512 [translate_table: standard]
MNSLNVSSYAKIQSESHLPTLGARRNTGKRILVTALVSIFLVVAVFCSVVGIVATYSKHKDRHFASVQKWKSTSNAVQHACSSTLYPELCVATVSSHPAICSESGPMDIVNVAVHVTMDAVKRDYARAQSLMKPGLDTWQHSALGDCMELLGETLDELNETLSNLKNATLESLPRHASDLMTLLSASITNQYTCLDGFGHREGNVRLQLQSRLMNVSHLVSNSLAMVKNMSIEASRSANGQNVPLQNRHLLSDHMDSHLDFMSHYGSVDDGFPSWLSAGDRRLLQASGRRSTRPDVVVAKDGSGNYKTITAAVKAAPENSRRRYVIHIKAGIYLETVEVHKKKTNLMFIGDGRDVTVIAGRKNVVDGSTTFHSATVGVAGKGFIARDITFENSAGPAKHQAVALRVASDFSAFYRCGFKAYQDTLYVHSFRQFYSECNIYGTVDFIFGNAAVVFQHCNLLARRPMDKQKILYTAQGREDPNQNTGISIQNCNVMAASDLAPVKRSFPAYLGRPWKRYSRTVFMQSYLGDLINPAGWLEWNGDFALRTLYYGEYQNRGPGARTANRVKWPGYRVITNPREASQFTVGRLISGNEWLPSTGINYVASFT